MTRSDTGPVMGCGRVSPISIPRSSATPSSRPGSWLVVGGQAPPSALHIRYQGRGVGAETGVGIGRNRTFWTELESVKFCQLRSGVTDHILLTNYGRVKQHSPENIGIWATTEEKWCSNEYDARLKRFITLDFQSGRGISTDYKTIVIIFH